VATVSDPHEIANVLGVQGVEYMIENGNQVPFKFNFGAPSCVPATHFETAGAEVSVEDIEVLLQRPDILYLAEMMNFPGVLHDEKDVLAKISIAKMLGKPVDGHAPGLRGDDARKYIEAGITTDHECFTYEEALEKLKLGMKILIREGSAAKNFEALIPLLTDYPEHIMFCSDDKHPDDLIEGHINELVIRALRKGYSLFKVLRAACINPVEHYSLDVGLLKEGDKADFIIVEDLVSFKLIATYIDGKCLAGPGSQRESGSGIKKIIIPLVNNFNCSPKSPSDFQVLAESPKNRIIEAINGEIITKSIVAEVLQKDGFLVADSQRDILKITVVNRYSDHLPAVAFIKNFGLQRGAIASCVGHDSHNIIAVGTSDEAICRAVNLIIEQKGGISAVSEVKEKVLALPVAGIMSDQDGFTVGKTYADIDRFVKEVLGSTLNAPFMTLSFMALLVIPELKLSDKGLFDGKKFAFTSLFV
jgi:adenine deaminase